MQTEWREAQRRERDRLWPDVERFLSGLPPILSGQMKLIEYDLALRYSPSGQLRDIFSGPDRFPLLSIGSWLIDDLKLHTGAKRQRVERRLFLAAFLLAARSHAIRAILDGTSFSDEDHIALVQLVSERSMTELSRLVPPGTRSGGLLEAIAVDSLEAMLVNKHVRRDPLSFDEPEAFLDPRWSAPGRQLALAALTVGGRLECASSVTAMLHQVAAAFEIMADLGSIHADLLAGRPTYPIAFVAHVAAVPLDPWPDATLTLGTLVATSSLQAIMDAAISRVRESHRVAADVGLGTFAAYLRDVEAGLEQRRPSLAREHASTTCGRDPGPALAPGDRRRVPKRPDRGTPARWPGVPLVTIAQPSLTKALEMAEGFLLSDPTFRESWESHREGMFGAPAVASRYPAGLILEIMCARGHDVSTPIDEFLAFTSANRFRYYDHPWSEIDSDTLGVYLRLTQDAATDGWSQAATPVLACLERDVAAVGRIPVWITDCAGSPHDRPFMLDLGEGCGTVSAHLLLGLLAHAPERYAATIERGARQLLDRIEDVGLGANINYPSVYALAAFGRLIARLEDPDLGILGGPTRHATRRSRRVLMGAFDRAIDRKVLTAQQAALLTIACRDLNRSEDPDPGWRAAILRRQRFDGSWIGEPFAAAPNRGLAVTWYSSTMLTSALCYDALMSFP